MSKFASLRAQLGIVALKGIGLSNSIVAALIFWLTNTVDDAEYPNKIGYQDREASGGAVFPGRAHAFDGVDQCAYVADNGALDVNQATTDFCVSGWAKANTSGSTEHMLGKNIAGDINGRYGFYKDASNLVRFRCVTDTETLSISTGIDGDIDVDSHLFVAHIDLSGKKVYVYVDGILANSGGDAFTGIFGSLATNYKFYMGAGNIPTTGAPTAYIATEIRDVRVYHKDITDTASLAALQRGERLGDELGWWWCEGTDLYEVWDASGNGYHMTAENFDSTSLVEGNWLSLHNKYGYAIDITDGIELVSNGDFSTGDTTDWLFTDCTGAVGDYFGRTNVLECTITNATTIYARQVLGLLVSRQYLLSADFYKQSSMTIGTLGIRNGTGYQVADLSVEDDWESLSGIAEIPDASNDDIYAYAATGTVGHKFYVDNMSAITYYNTAIPPDMSTVSSAGVPQQDIFGNDLVFKGQAQYKAVARDRNCFVGDGVGYWNMGSGVAITTGMAVEWRAKITDGTIDNQGIFGGTAGAYSYMRFGQATGEALDNMRGETDTDSDNIDLEFLSSLVEDTWYTFKLENVGGTTWNLYLDGVLQDSTTTTDNSITFDVIGAARNTVDVFAGNLSWMRVYNSSGQVINQYEFVEGNGSIVHDVSGNGNHLTGTNISENNWGTIDFPDEDYLAEYGANFVGNFNGVDDYIDTGIDLEGSSYVDLTVRLYRASVSGENNIVQYQNAAYSCGLYWASGNIYALVGAGVSGNAFGRYNSDLTGWVKIRMVFDGSLSGNENRLKLYVNDIQVVFTDIVGTIPVSAPSIGNDFWLGRRGSIYDDGKLSYIKLISNGVTLLDSYITGIDSEDTFGTWAGTGEHSAIIPALSDKSADALGQPLVYTQNGRNVIPHTYLSMPENVYEVYAADQQERYELDSPALWDDWTVAANISDWNIYGTNTLIESGGYALLAYVDNALGAYRRIRAANEYGKDLVSGDDYRIIARLKNNQGSSAARVYDGTGYGSPQSLTTEFQYYIFDFTCNDASGVFFAFTSMASGDIITIGSLQVFHKTTQYGNNLIANGGARNEIGALITTDFVDTDSDGVADGFSLGSIGNTGSIVTGNGFNGNAQQLVNDGTGNIQLNVPGAYYEQNRYVTIKMKYRTNRSDISWSNGVVGTALSANTGDAIEYEETLLMTSASGARSLRLISAATASASDYLEIDELEIQPNIDGEFYEPEDLGGDPVVLGVNYLLANPWRYLTRYLNVQDRKDLLLLEADELDYDDHVKLLKFTKNNG